MRIAALTALVVIACSPVLSGASAAQDVRNRITAVTAAAAPVYVLPDAERTPLRTLPPGTRLRVLREQGEWLRVEFDDPWWGPRVGYIEKRLVEITEEEPAPPALRDAAPMQPAPPRRPAARGPVRFDRVWIDANGGVAIAGERDYSSVGTVQMNGQEATFQADYHLPPGPAFDVGAGVMVTRMVGIGATLSGSTQEDPAMLSIDIPHPILQGANATATGDTVRSIRRRESSLHIHGMLVSQTSPEMRARVFGGPTYFRIEQDAVGDIVFDQSFVPFEPVHEVEITSASIQRIPYEDATGWGFHAGADVSWFFTRGLGAGTFARYSRGTVEILDPLTAGAADLDVGGFQVGGGLRVKF